MKQKLYYILLAISILGVFIAFGLQFYFGMKTIDKEEHNLMFPPWPSKCPDYWEVDSIGKCKNVHKIGQCKSLNDTDNVMDFNDDLFTGNEGIYNKCEWAKTCNAPWEGIDSTC